MANKPYGILWDELIAAICREVVKIENLPAKARTVEDIWVEGTLCNVLKKMCALHRLPPKMQKEDKLTRPLFEADAH